MHKLLAVILLLVPLYINAETIILSKTSIGKLSLNEGDKISVKLVKEAFPEYEVKHGIGQGDSPDFHYIDVMEKDGTGLFSIYSYFDDSVNKKTQEYDIDLLSTRNPKVIDEHGVRVGDTINKAIKLRKKELELSANHFTNSLGAEKIHYQFSLKVDPEHREKGIDWVDVESVTKEQVITQNPIIRKISWPTSSWD